MRKIIVFLLLSSMLGIIVGAICSAAISSDLPDVETLRDVQLQVPLRIYTSDGKLLSEFGDQRRIPIKLAQVPPLFIKAVLATEDRDASFSIRAWMCVGYSVPQCTWLLIQTVAKVAAPLPCK